MASDNFGDYFIKNRPSKKSFLADIDKTIDWKKIEKLLLKKVGKGKSADGRPSYPVLTMFKILLLQSWYNLSDEGVEEEVLDRSSFWLFCGLGVSDPVPDSTTICRFRNSLIKANLHKRILKQLNKQLEKKGLLIKTGAIVDASLIKSQRRARKVVEVVPEDRKEEGCTENKVKVTYSDDTEADFTKKRGELIYGYKLHMSTDVSAGYVLTGHITPASHSDTKEFEKVVSDSKLPKDSCVLADKGYTSKSNIKFLKENQLIDGIMRKKPRGKDMPDFLKIFNKAISKVRFIVERTFGSLKKDYDLDRAKYLSSKKVEAQFCFAALAFNMKKAAKQVNM